MTRMRTGVLATWWCATMLAVAAPTASANDLGRDEEVVLFPTYAAVDPAEPTSTLPVHGWIYEPETDSDWRNESLDRLALLLSLTEQEKLSPVFRQRARLFLVDNERNQRLLIRVASRQVTLSASEPNGHIRSLLKLPTAELLQAARPAGSPDSVLRYALDVPRGDPRAFLGRVHLVGPEGWSVVSDIDDTIKHSNVLDKSELMRHTFLRKFTAVDGMAAAYGEWVRGGAAVHYVSGSPWQLYPSLAEFTADAGFPEGTFHLRHFRIYDGSARELLQPPQEYKVRTIDQILQAFPRRKFVLVGDSGEQDPEVYGELARRHPEQVRLVAIRNITDESLDNARMKGALHDVPAERCLLFREAGALPTWKQLTKEAN